MQKRHVVTVFLIRDEEDSTPSPEFSPLRRHSSFSIHGRRSSLPAKQGSRVLLIKRGEQARTYRDHWAGISGLLDPADPTPLHRAYAELQKATSLASREVALIRTALPLIYSAPSLQTEWHVHPFLFKLHVRSEHVKIELENEGVKWVRVDEVNEIAGGKETEGMQMVPYLREAFHRVYLPEPVHQALLEMHLDRSSGAQQLAHQAICVLRELARSHRLQKCVADTRELWLAYVNIGWHLSQIRPTMRAGIVNEVARVLLSCKPAEGWTLEKVENQVEQAVTEIENERPLLEERIRLGVVEALGIGAGERESVTPEDENEPDSDEESEEDGRPSRENQSRIHVLTMSYSSSIALALEHVIDILPPNLQLMISVAEARPLCEGGALVKRLAARIRGKRNVKIALITDAAVGYFMQGVTHILFGADRIFPDGSVRNKIGSFMLALFARYFHRKIFCISTSDKIGEDDEAEEENDVEEVTKVFGQDPFWQQRDGGLDGEQVRVRNVYFEKVPAELVSGYVMDCSEKPGVVGRDEVEKAWQEKRHAGRVFEEL
ncbi:uncharacterized protein VTP21DRAFT_7721 [Calcarisporiella thermophila]|uniref:uncharacterized protein n=1 Tax=Calcarisporiella thermophila TaxID=911321 RepID=UPI00374315C2